MKKQNTWIRQTMLIVVVSILSGSVVSHRLNTEMKQLKSNNQKLQNENNKLQTKVDSLQGEMDVQKNITDHFVYLWEQMEGLHPKDAEKFKHETE
jgi:hypothetical protein